MLKMLRINMANLTTKLEEIPSKYYCLGGRGLTSTIIYNEVPPTCNPLSKYNKVVIASGLLGGTSCANSGRVSVGSKSPLTGTIKESNSGGQFGGALPLFGIQCIIIEGINDSNNLYKLVITKDKYKILQANELKNLGNYNTVKELVNQYGKDSCYCTIGQAGEMKLASASVAFTDRETKPTRHAGRGGMGAVIGSKKLKAIILCDIKDNFNKKDDDIFDRESFKKASKLFSQSIVNHPVTNTGLSLYGTDILINIINEAGGLPTKNFSAGYFKDAEKVSGEFLNEITKKRGGRISCGCMSGCLIKCSGDFINENGKWITKWPEYETVWAFGPNCNISDIDAIARYDKICDDIGIDTIETGCAISVAMEAGIKEFGDVDGVEELLKEIKAGSYIGRILGNGTAITGNIFGVTRVPVVKNQSLAAYDPRAIKGIGVTFATSPMGADHTAGYTITSNIMNVGGYVDPLSTDNQVVLSRNLQIATVIIDTVGLCLFVAFPILDIPESLQYVIDMINAKFNYNLKAEDLTNLGKKIISIEREFNFNAGITFKSDRLPDFFINEKLKPHNSIFDIKNKEIDSTLKFK